MFDTLGTNEIGCVLLFWKCEMRFIQPHQSLVRIEEKPAQCKEKNTEALLIALYTLR
jgi:hypothetical protein